MPIRRRRLCTECSYRWSTYEISVSFAQKSSHVFLERERLANQLQQAARELLE